MVKQIELSAVLGQLVTFLERSKRLFSWYLRCAMADVPNYSHSDPIDIKSIIFTTTRSLSVGSGVDTSGT